MRISGITLPENKRLEIALTAVYGVGRSRAKMIIEKCGLDMGMKTTALTADEENLIRREIELFKTEGDLKRETQQNIKRLKDIKAYRGVRHIRHLPARGQRTKTNSRTVRGNVRRTMGSGRRKTEKT
ncbi:MAG: 30S ribosomal protein S13 [Candidatus Pacebacteria bacterium]|nr:30S ribosomal protein S13 [Candidatus Paceibacterota bacterium]MBP9867257.1 30S ribosomal protein S13 [Candidatus Paceibacterota bacterium]